MPSTEDEPKTEDELNHATREQFRKKIKSGEINDRKIEVEIQQNNSSSIGVMGPVGVDDAQIDNIKEMIGGMMPKKTKKRKINIEEAKKLLFEEEAAKLIDMDEVKEEAIKRAENTGIIFIDEIDKIASNKDGGKSGDVSREGVQRDLLPIIEGSSVNTRYGVLNTNHVLFIAAGAFHVSKPSDLIPELQGRLPIRVELEDLTKDDFYRIIKEPKNALTKQYTALLTAENVVLEFNDDALKKIAEIAFEINSEIENIGARRLHTVMSKLLNDFLFDIPEKIQPKSKLIIDSETVEEKLGDLVCLLYTSDAADD